MIRICIYIYFITISICYQLDIAAYLACTNMNLTKKLAKNIFLLVQFSYIHICNL